MKTKKSKKIRLICFVFLLIFTITFMHNHISTRKVVYTSCLSYTIQSNDTLWDIATKYNFNDQDIRQVIYDIQKFNHVGSEIYPGQTIIIPIDSLAAERKTASRNLVANRN